MSEESFLRYRLEVVQRMLDGPLKAAIVTAIAARAEVLTDVEIGGEDKFRFRVTRTEVRR